MPTIEVPREAWVRRLDEFTRLHEGWLVSVDVLGPDIGAQPEIQNVPLLGVSTDRLDHDGTIVISVAKSATDHFTHFIHSVTRFHIERTAQGADAALQFESAGDTRTVLRFRATALPETVDGIVRR